MVLRLILVLSVVCSVGCSGGDDSGGDGTCNPAIANAGSYSVSPRKIHTGSNGRDSYQAPIFANFGDFEISSSDDSIATVERHGCVDSGDEGPIAVVTGQSEGAATITISSGSVDERIGVTVLPYSVQQYDLGKQRYEDPDSANATDRRACNSCHFTGGGGAPHSPSALAGHSDAQLVFAAINSVYPDYCVDENGANCSCEPVDGACCAGCTFTSGETLSLAATGGGPGEHMFDLTRAEQFGIMAFVRAIEPEAIE